MSCPDIALTSMDLDWTWTALGLDLDSAGWMDLDWTDLEDLTDPRAVRCRAVPWRIVNGIGALPSRRMYDTCD